MAKQNLSDNEISSYVAMLSNMVSPSDTKESVMILFGAFVGLVADDCPEKARLYLFVLEKALKNKRPNLRLVNGKHPTRPGPWGKYPGGPHYPNFGLDAEIV